MSNDTPAAVKHRIDKARAEATPKATKLRVDRLREEAISDIGSLIRDLDVTRKILLSGGSPPATHVPSGRLVNLVANLAALAATIDAIDDTIS